MSSPSWQHQILARIALPLTGIRRNNTAARLPKTLAGTAKKPIPQPNGTTLRGLDAKLEHHQGWPVWTLTPPPAPDKQRHTIIAIHGGAYVHQISHAHYNFYAELARATGAKVMVPIYPLAPDGTASSVVPVMADLISEQIQNSKAGRIVVQGDSAGGGLALAAVQELVRSGRPVPALLLLISPWLDVTIPDPRSKTTHDPMLDREGLLLCGRMWAGDLTTNHPLVSPLYGSLKGLPDIAVYSGTSDLLYPDSLRLATSAAAQKTNMALDLRNGLIHGWAMMPVTPEGRSAAHDMARLINQ